MRKVATENRATIFHIDSPSPRGGQAPAEDGDRIDGGWGGGRLPLRLTGHRQPAGHEDCQQPSDHRRFPQRRPTRRLTTLGRSFRRRNGEHVRTPPQPRLPYSVRGREGSDTV